MGEAQPLLQKTKVKGRRARSYSQWRWRLRAIEHVHFSHGYGEKKSEAIFKVAMAMGVGVDAVKGWDKNRLGEHFQETEIEAKKASTQAIGASVRERERRSHGTDEDDDYINVALEAYRAPGLERTAKKFRSVLAPKNAD